MHCAMNIVHLITVLNLGLFLLCGVTVPWWVPFLCAVLSKLVPSCCLLCHLKLSCVILCVIFVSLQLVLALGYIHKEKHIVHRDLSASNVMIGADLSLCLTDFGLAKQKQREMSVMNSVVGTMPYWR